MGLLGPSGQVRLGPKTGSKVAPCFGEGVKSQTSPFGSYPAAIPAATRAAAALPPCPDCGDSWTQHLWDESW